MKRRLLTQVGLLPVAAITACANGPSGPGPDTMLQIQPGTAVTIDGALGTSEWTDADVIDFSVGNASHASIRFKHDGTSLLFAFVFTRATPGSLSHPEIYIDASNDSGTEWQADDWWFHLSGTDCEAHGASAGREETRQAQCRTDQPDWHAVPNVPSDTMEISITFDKINISVGDRFGIAFNIHYHDNEDLFEGLWPGGAVAEGPNTWGAAEIQ